MMRLASVHKQIHINTHIKNKKDKWIVNNYSHWMDLYEIAAIQTPVSVLYISWILH